MPDTTPNLGAKYLTVDQALAEVTHNDALNFLDVLVQPTILDKDLTSPPGSPTNGDRYIVGAAATGDWATHDGEVAIYYSGWLFITPQEGWGFYVVDEDGWYLYDGTAWIPGVRVPSVTDGTRPSPTGRVGHVIYNSTDGGLNVSNGTAWRAPSGGWVNT